MNNDRAGYRKWVREMSGGKVVAYYPGFVRLVGGVKTALLLCQLLYWHGICASESGQRARRRRDGWFYKSVEELQNETGLSKCEQQSARRALVALGVIEARLRGIPRVWYYRVDLQRLVDLMKDPEADELPEAVVQPEADELPGAENLSGAGFHPVEAPLDGKPAQSKGQTVPTLGGKSTQLNKESKSTPQNTEILAGEDQNGKSARSDPPRDPRLSHPAVILLKTVTGLIPPKAVMDRVIRALGDAPEAERFADVHEAWCARGFRRTNLEGQLDWYGKGIPPFIPPARAGRRGTQAPPVKRLVEDPRSEAELADLRAKLRASREAKERRE